MTVVHTIGNGEEDLLPAVLIFVFGWFICCIWFANFRYMKSQNPTARLLAIFSAVMAVLSSIGIVVGIIVNIVLVATVASAMPDITQPTGYNTGYNTGYTGY